MCIHKEGKRFNGSSSRRGRAVKLISFDYRMLPSLCGLTWQSHVSRVHAAAAAAVLYVHRYAPREHAPLFV